MDGGGFPNRRDGANISLLGRMAAICDTYDTLIDGNDDSAGVDPGAALQTMSGMAGALDAMLMKYFIGAIGVYPVGSLVLLRSRRLALVVDQSADNPARPKVCAFYAVTTTKMVTPVVIDLAQCFGEDAIESLADPDSFCITDFPRVRDRLFASASLSRA